MIVVKKRFFPLLIAFVMMFSITSESFKKDTYAFAFAPALIPVVVSLLAACGIFITYTSATDDLESVIDDFLSSDAELGDFVNGIYDQSLVTGSVALNAAQIAFFTDVFIAQAYSYFSKVNSDMDLSGTVWHPLKDLFEVRIPFGATVNYRPSSSSSWGRFVSAINGSVWQIKWYDYSSTSSQPDRTRDAVSSVSHFFLHKHSYFPSGDSYQMSYYTVNPSGDSLRFNLGYSMNTSDVLQVSAVTIGSIGYCTNTYATNMDLELKTGYLRDTSVSADAIKASILAADEVYVTPLTDVAGLSTYNNSVVGVYDDGLIGGVVLNPDAVIDDPVVVDPEVPITPDLTGIAGGLSSILSWLKALPATLSRTFLGTADLNFDALKNSGFTTKFPFCIPFDLYHCIVQLVADPVPPVFTLSFTGTVMESAGDIVIDMSKFEMLAKIIRYFIFFGFVLGLIKITRNLIKG